MGVRRKARELALKVVFRCDFTGEALATVLDHMHKELDVAADVMPFCQKLIDSLDAHSKDIDGLIEGQSNHWKLGRMARVDRNILRLGVAEICYFEDIPKSVSINEYLEIAKKYGNDESSGFVNGILDKIKKPE